MRFPVVLASLVVLIGFAEVVAAGEGRGGVFVVSQVNGALGEGNSWGATFSDDASVVAFLSSAPNLADKPPAECGRPERGLYAPCTQVLFSETASGRIGIASANASGAVAAGDTYSPGISGDGDKITFASFAGNLVPEDTGGFYDVFLFSRARNHLERITVNETLVQADGPVRCAIFCGSHPPSPTGGHVLFSSWATNLVPADTNDRPDVIMRDLQTNQNLLVSQNVNGSVANDASYLLSTNRLFTENDMSVVFVSVATDLVPDTSSTCPRDVGFWGVEVKGCPQIYLRNISTGTTILISATPEGQPGDGLSSNPEVSANGRLVFFISKAPNLIGTHSSVAQLYVRDLDRGVSKILSVGPGGEPANAPVDRFSISADGRRVAFESDASNLVAADQNAVGDIFVLDVERGKLVLASRTYGGEGLAEASIFPAISGNGKWLAFTTTAENVVPGVGNGKGQIYAMNIDALFGELTTDAEISTAGAVPATVAIMVVMSVFVSSCWRGKLR